MAVCFLLVVHGHRMYEVWDVGSCRLTNGGIWSGKAACCLCVAPCRGLGVWQMVRRRRVALGADSVAPRRRPSRDCAAARAKIRSSRGTPEGLVRRVPWSFARAGAAGSNGKRGGCGPKRLAKPALVFASRTTGKERTEEAARRRRGVVVCVLPPLRALGEKTRTNEAEHGCES